MPEACNFIKKETLARAFSCEFCKIFKNTFCHRTPLMVASVIFAEQNFGYIRKQIIKFILLKKQNAGKLTNSAIHTE